MINILILYINVKFDKCINSSDYLKFIMIWILY